ncbi:MAG: hypothetical protein Q9168_003461 [Polycauliona sp. 1 TL-2023]
MEHLPLPRHIASPGPASVPYVAIEYDRGDFLTYPARQGRAAFSEAVSDHRLCDSAGIILTPLPELESFIQTWLFFGLLNEVLGDVSIQSDWVCWTSSPDSPRWVVTTAKLVPVLNHWVNIAGSSAAVGKRAQYYHIAECLELSRDVLEVINYETRPDFNRQIRLSIASVAELVDNVANLAFGKTCPRSWCSFYKDDETIAQFRDHGYCPSEIRRILNTFLTISTLYLLSWVKRNNAEQSALHDYCNEAECQANSMRAKQRASTHLDAGCTCGELSVDISKVVGILSKGSLPLLRMKVERDTGVFDMAVVEALPNIEYIAISHVWADGLGNPVANALPLCQLRRLHGLVASLCGSTDSDDTFIWLDTLCCPVKPPEAKKLALGQMFRPYTDAFRVLVLDSSLRDVESSQLHPTEICLRAFASGWMGRLWTLQEGALARNLWFQFSDTAVNLTELRFELNMIYPSDLGRRGLIFDATCAYRGLRRFNSSDLALQGLYPFPDLSAVGYGLRHRAVTVATDEPLLIGGLLRLDLAHILNGSESSRMQRLWSVIPSVKHGIPKSVLFLEGPKLCEPGFRWAPTTLRDTESLSPGEEPGVLTAAGLRVSLAALPITVTPAAHGLPAAAWGPFHDMYCRYDNGTWVFVIPAHVPDTQNLLSLLQDGSKRHTLLLANPFMFDRSIEFDKALLVAGGDDLTGVPEVSSEMLLYIGTRVGSVGVLLESAYQAAQLLLADDITEKFLCMGIEDIHEQRQSPDYQDLVSSLLEKMRVMAENIEDVEVQEALRTQGQYGNAVQFYQSVVFNAYVGNCGILGPMMPTDSQWCVD